MAEERAVEIEGLCCCMPEYWRNSLEEGIIWEALYLGCRGMARAK